MIFEKLRCIKPFFLVVTGIVWFALTLYIKNGSAQATLDLTVSKKQVRIISNGQDYAEDAMHGLGIAVNGVYEIESMLGTANIVKNESQVSGSKVTMEIRVIANEKITIFKLNNSQASRDLFAQLPLTIPVENYGGNEKIFYPPKKLAPSGAPSADAKTGTLAYYAPWGNVVMFYGRFGSASGLYELGQAVSGDGYIKHMSGTIQIEKSAGQ